MPITVRLLEPERHSEIPVPIGTYSMVVVAEDVETKELKGYWVAQPIVHLEPVWLDEDLRSGFTGIRMFATLLASLQSAGISGYYAQAATPEVATYLERLGLKLVPYLTYEGQVPPIPEKAVEECLTQSHSL